MVSKKNTYPILLTGTINPGDYAFVGIKDVDSRENDYFYSIQFYRNLGLKVVFVDNSNFSSKRISVEFESDKGFEYLKYSSQKSILGKGHGEKEIIDYALKNSSFIKNSDFFIKITGRIKVLNLSFLLDRIDFSHDIVYGNFSRCFSWADTRLMFISKKFYYDFFSPHCDIYLNESEKEFIERVYAKSIHSFLSFGGKFRYFPMYPLYSGINGTNGKIYDLSLFRRFKYSLFLKIKIWINDQTI